LWEVEQWVSMNLWVSLAVGSRTAGQHVLVDDKQLCVLLSDQQLPHVYWRPDAYT